MKNAIESSKHENNESKRPWTREEVREHCGLNPRGGPGDERQEGYRHKPRPACPISAARMHHARRLPGEVNCSVAAQNAEREDSHQCRVPIEYPGPWAWLKVREEG